MLKHYSIAAALLLSTVTLFGQDSAEDSLTTAGKKPSTYIGGYGNAFLQYNSDEEQSRVNLERVVFFIGHRFNDKFSFFSELEVEDAKVSGGEEGGEVAFEQAYLKMNVSRNSYLTAGLFLPRIGIMNESHLPNTFNGNERTQIEQYIIPSTWRELGVGFYTKLNSLPLNLSFALVNGLNSAGFEHGTVIRGGRYEGQEASANALAITGAAQYIKNDFTFQLSGYMGGSVGLSKVEADTLGLDGGPFGTPVILTEADVQYSNSGFVIKVLGTMVNISKAESINHVYNNETPETAFGIYGEVGYDFLHSNSGNKNRALVLFARYETMDMNSTVPENVTIDPSLVQQHIIAGLSYLPIPQIAIKGDVRISKSDATDSNTLVNLGFGFSF